MLHAVAVAAGLFAAVLVFAAAITGLWLLACGPVDDLLAGEPGPVEDLDGDWGWPE